MNADFSLPDKRFELFPELFNCYATASIMRIVEMKKSLKWPVLNSLTPKQLLADINWTTVENYEFEVEGQPFRDPRTMGNFYPLFTGDDQIIRQPSASLVELLKHPAVLPVLCTNGKVGHYCAYKLITQKLGVDILGLLQIKLLAAKKPMFFTADTCLSKFELAPTHASIEGLMATDVDEVYTQSSAQGLLEHLASKGLQVASKVHVGDNPVSDTGYLAGYTTIMIYRELLERETVASLSGRDVQKATCYLEVWGSALEDEGREVLGFAASKYRSARVFPTLDSPACIEFIRSLIPV